ncbi:MAG: ribonuclease H-like domain-containing protein [Methanobacteriota archaeon]|nr:MAG: ribonuclease H-like domain-containing protein [Euryarchaeota archaeon]
MLRRTFVHIPGIGYQTEKRIWENGIQTWDEFLAERREIPLKGRTREFAQSYVRESKKHLDGENHHFFADKIPRRELWRAYHDFKERTAFLDIETTGLDYDRHEITLIGVYDGKEARTFTRGKNLHQFPKEIKKFKSIVTYNGARFDLPFILSTFPKLALNQIHIDIMYPLRRLGYSGGLKAIERQVGVSRSDETDGLSGWDAVVLWKKHLRGDRNALNLLEKYNLEDIVNLETLSDLVYDELKREYFP